MPEKGASKTGNGSNRIARRKRKSKKGWSPGRIGKVGTEKEEIVNGWGNRSGVTGMRKEVEGC